MWKLQEHYLRFNWPLKNLLEKILIKCGMEVKLGKSAAMINSGRLSHVQVCILVNFGLLYGGTFPGSHVHDFRGLQYPIEGLLTLQ